MAKSIRSKWKRKMRAKKREKNTPKELAKLVKTLAMDPHSRQADVDMEHLVTDVTKNTVSKKEIPNSSDGSMEVPVDGSKKQVVDEHGHYPVWMNQRKIRKVKAIRKRLQRRKKK